MAVLIDPPAWPAHGRLWSHLVSDSSLAELHAVAARAGLPRRAFEGDHYDVPAERFEQAVAAGARPVGARELLSRLVASGLRVPKRRGERVLRSEPAPDWLPGGGPQLLDLLASRLPVPEASSPRGSVLVRDAAGRVLLAADGGGWALPGGPRRPGEDADAAPRRWAAAAGVSLAGPVTAAGYLRVRLAGPTPPDWPYPGRWVWFPLHTATPDPHGPGDATPRWAGPAVARRALAGRHPELWPLLAPLLDVPG